MQFVNNIGSKIRHARKRAGLTQKDCADICSVKQLSAFENGQAVPSEEVLKALAARLQVPDEEFIDDQKPIEVPAPALVEQPKEELTLENIAEFVGGMGVPQVEGGAPYLSRTERNNFIFLNAFVHKADQIAEEMKAHNANPLHVMMFDVGARLIAKGMASRLMQLDKKTFQQFDRETYIRDVALVYRSDAKMHIKRFVEEDTRIRTELNAEMGGDPIHDMAEIIMVTNCRGCDGSVRHSKEGCLIYNALHGVQIEEWDPAHAKCPYAYAGQVEAEYERV